MAKIHWLVYIIVGLFVSIFSWKSDFETLRLFFYFGLVFVLVGIVKMMFNIKRSPKEEKMHHKASQQHKGKYCHNCGSPAQLHHSFCTKCGARL